MIIEQDDVQTLTISQLFSSCHYIIPIYQRNYAWGEEEIEQLIQDIWDVMQLSRGESQYFIGSLIVAEREGNSFETIDGQQRHTTLSILLAVLKNVFMLPLPKINEVNLHFDCRPESSATLRIFFKDGMRCYDAAYEYTFYKAWEIITRYFKKTKIDSKLFLKYLLENVVILRVTVPRNTDLNHYFEIMNNRGEQLEKHEILKARLMGKLGENSGDDERKTFAMIWDACAGMQSYVQMNVPANLRSAWFGYDWNQLPAQFDVLVNSTVIGENDPKNRPLYDIVYSQTSSPASNAGFAVSSEANTRTFASVISFSNFLLQVLHLEDSAIPLDDKRLLESFIQSEPDPRRFIMKLLKCRMLLDRYIIKRDSDSSWKIRCLKSYEKSAEYHNSFTFSENSTIKLNENLSMLLSMFQVSFPSQTYKYWLYGALFWLDKHAEPDTLQVSGVYYLSYLEKMANYFLLARLTGSTSDHECDFNSLDAAPMRLSVEISEMLLHKGTDVQNYIFNRLDYLLWLALKNKTRFDGVNMDYIYSRAENFTFTYRSSVEHYWPQHPSSNAPKLESTEILVNGVHNFGNLCLISHENNSRFSNFLPTAKKEHYKNSTYIESLKQLFMLSYEEWGPEAIDSILHHKNMMIKVLLSNMDI